MDNREQTLAKKKTLDYNNKHFSTGLTPSDDYKANKGPDLSPEVELGDYETNKYGSMHIVDFSSTF
jgi:hypothetical protein